MRVKLYFLKFIQKYLYRFASPHLFNEILKLEGITVGAHTIFYSPNSITIDRQRPWMLKIGDYCKITRGVTILCHDYSRSVVRKAFGPIVAEAGMTEIADNVFIGVNSIIMMGTRIGNNSIIGAGSVVRGTFPDNVVIAGNPAKIICTLEDFYSKRKARELDDLVMYMNSFRHKYSRFPLESELGPFFHLCYKHDSQVNAMFNGDDIEDVFLHLQKSKSMFSSYEELIHYVETSNSK